MSNIKPLRSIRIGQGRITSASIYVCIETAPPHPSRPRGSEMSDDWLRNLQPGDVAAISPSGIRPPARVTVERVTKKMVVTDDGRRWNRDRGIEVGSCGYYPSHLVQLTSRVQECIDHAQLRSWLRGVDRQMESKNLDDLPLLKTLRRAYDDFFTEPEPTEGG